MRIPVIGVLAPAALLALLAAGCEDSAGPPPAIDYTAIDPIIYSEHVQPVFQASCAVAGCHTGAASTALGLSLDGYESLAAGSDWGSVVVPRRPERSHLYLHVSGEVPPRMPFERDPLEEPVIEFLRRWIAGGAAFDDGADMYAGVTHKAFVACQGEDLVAVLDMNATTIRKGRVIRLLDVKMPHSVWVDADSRRLYVSRFETASDNLRVYDADTYELLDSGQAGSFPALLMTTPDGSQLWVTNYDAGSNPDNLVRVFDPADLGDIRAFSFPNAVQPHGLAMTAGGSLVFISNIGSSTVSVYATNIPAGPPSSVHGSIELPGGPGQQPQQCVLSADETRLFVSALGSNKVHVLDVTNVDQPGWLADWTSVDVGQAPWHMALSPSGDELWVVNWIGESISIVDVSNPDQPVVARTLQPEHPRHSGRAALERPMGIAFSPDGNLVYVTSTNDTNENQGHHPPPGGQKNPGNVAIFDAVTKDIVNVVEVPNFARFISFLP